ncbi:hypothetical protein PE067_10510 [Paracoccus sp. DMF-8]|uniref:hypothetical protein n=1 Tax=Paracoccus sp. DMF-8 TaxID=3019445 RepID=UPI0023E89D8D|nr:hypothetical protein [Paracoccus sp. DMF-8]MDF3606532.1 hypothetical protein [Paracoccus sp. DMF-8]
MNARPILCLDLATTTGWASGVPGERPVSHKVRFGKTGADDGEVIGKLMQWLGDYITSTDFGMVVFEAPVGPGMAGRTNFKTMARLVGMCKAVEAVCYLHNVPVYQASAATIRKEVLGTGRPENPKAAVMAEMRARGFDPADDNEADALALYFYASALLSDHTTKPRKAATRRK